MENINQKNNISYEMIRDYIINVLGMKPTISKGNATVYEFENDNSLVFSQIHNEEDYVYLTLGIIRGKDAKSAEDLFSATNPTKEEFLKFSEMAKNEIEKGRLETLGVVNNPEDIKYSEKDIRGMIDVALDKRDYKEVDRLSKMLPEQVQRLIECIIRFKQLIK